MKDSGELYPKYIEKFSIYRETRGEGIRLGLKNLISGAHRAPSSNQNLQTFHFYREYEQEEI